MFAKSFVATAITSTALLTGCSGEKSSVSTAGTEIALSTDKLPDLMRRVENWQCPVPAGGEHISPLYYLKADDRAHIKEARERIELTRRHRNESWEAAESAFRFKQMHFALDFYNTVEHKERTLLGLRQAADGVPLFRGPPHEFVNEKKHEYDRDCTSRNEGISAMLADEPKLAALRKEARQPWLLERNRIACFLASVSNCEN